MTDKSKKGQHVEAGAWNAAGVDPNSEIGAKLKAYFSSVQSEPIPDRFLDLLEKLDATERKTSGDVSEA